MNDKLLKCQNEIHKLHKEGNQLQDVMTKYTEIQNKLDTYEKHTRHLEEGNKTLREKNSVIENTLM